MDTMTKEQLDEFIRLGAKLWETEHTDISLLIEHQLTESVAPVYSIVETDHTGRRLLWAYSARGLLEMLRRKVTIENNSHD